MDPTLETCGLKYSEARVLLSGHWDINLPICIVKHDKTRGEAILCEMHWVSCLRCLTGIGPLIRTDHGIQLRPTIYLRAQYLQIEKGGIPQRAPIPMRVVILVFRLRTRQYFRKRPDGFYSGPSVVPLVLVRTRRVW
jgi:hypothetical protein